MPYVYLLRCADGSFYVGSTRDLERRLAQHNTPDQGAAYTRSRRPVSLAWSRHYDNVAEAFTMEKRLRKWSHAKRAALAEGRFDDLRELSRSRRSPDTRRPQAGAGA